MKKAIFMGIVFSFIAFGAMSYMSYLGTGQIPFLQKLLSSSSPESMLDTIKDKAATATQEVTKEIKSTKTKVYKWQDEQGQWHFGNRPPEDASKAQLVTIDQKLNVIDAVKIPEPKVEKQQTKVQGSQPILKPNAYSPKQVKKTIEDAKNVQNLLNERMEEQQKILDNIN